MTPHEKGIEAAAAAFVTACRDYTDWSGSKQDNVRSIIAAYLSAAQPTSEGG